MLQKFQTAISVLPVSCIECERIELAGLADVAVALNSFVLSVSEKLAFLRTLESSIEALHTALITDQFVQKSSASLGKITTIVGQLSTLTIPGITVNLHNLQIEFLSATPHLAALLSQLHHINNTVMTVPQDIQNKVDVMFQAKVRILHYKLVSYVIDNVAKCIRVAP